MRKMKTLMAALVVTGAVAMPFSSANAWWGSGWGGGPWYGGYPYYGGWGGYPGWGGYGWGGYPGYGWGGYPGWGGYGYPGYGWGYAQPQAPASSKKAE
jgi:hypothetical protein